MNLAGSLSVLGTGGTVAHEARRAVARGRVKQVRDRGSAALEFALLVPVLMLMICGFIEGSRMYQAHLALSYAAREGARVLAVGDHDAAAAHAVVLDRAFPLEAGRLTVGSNVDVANRTVEMSVAYAYVPILLPDMEWIIPPVTVTMRAE